MIRGLQITMPAKELSDRIAERIRLHEGTLCALDARIKRREGDQPFDIRGEDALQTFAELQSERQHYADRVLQLTMLRDNLFVGETYALCRADLRLAELISPDFIDASSTADDCCVADRAPAAIDGLKLTIDGEELRKALEQRIQDHRRRADRWQREQARTPEQQTEDEPLLPEEMCANEAERHAWRVDVLGFIRDHIEPATVYRLGEADLAFGEVLPEKPGWMKQEEYEERTSIGFHLDRLTRSVGGLVPSELAFSARHAVGDDE
jgi:hypothetical protein